MTVANKTKTTLSAGQTATIYGSGLFAVFGLIIFLARAKAGINLFEFGDEAEKFVAAQMIGHGMKLYQEIFAHHGPVPYIISHLYSILVSATDFTHIRWTMVGLALLSAMSIYFSPVLKSNAARMLSVGAYLSLLSSIWVLQGIHMILYHQIGGFLLVIPTMQLFVPLLLGSAPTRSGLIVSGLAIVVACFTAYAFGPSSILLLLSALILLVSKDGLVGLRRHAMPFILGLAIGLSALLTWIFLFADLKGFFVYHFYFNQEIYSQFIGFDLRGIKNLFTLSFNPQTLMHALVLVGLIFWLGALIFMCFRIESRKRMFWGLLSLSLFTLSVFFLNPRGGIGFHDAGFIVLNISLLSLVCALHVQDKGENPDFLSTPNALLVIVVSVFVFEQASQDAISSPHGVAKRDFENHSSFMKPSEDLGFKFIRSMSAPNSDVLALIFNPGFYIKADRRPASGHYYYLPWQAAYNKSAVDGYKIDICQDIKDRRPSVIWFDNWKVWDKYSIDQYEPCVPEIINQKYVHVKGAGPIFLRVDLLTNDLKELNTVDRRMQPSPQLSKINAIKLYMRPGNGFDTNELRRIGVMFGTHVRQNPGEAELAISSGDGSVYRQEFSLSELVDNRYQYFDVPAGKYISGEIRSVSGIGVSAWESHDDNGEVLTCISYEYVDGKYGFTPGCPLF